MKSSVLILSSLALALTVACDRASDTSPNGTLPQGAMSYTAYDDAGRLVVKGWIRLDVPNITPAPGDIVTGEWELHAFVDPSRIGGQDGRGPLEGNFQDGHLVVALYPGLADAGCFLDGVLTGGGGPGPGMAFAGTWNDQSIAGPRHRGTFQARQ